MYSLILQLVPAFTSEHLKNPINWALFFILFYLLRCFAVSNKSNLSSPKHPTVYMFKNYTPISLLSNDGNNGTAILMAVNGSVYDVSGGQNFYGPGGPYANFAGHDASRGLAKNSFDEDMMADPYGSIDKLEDLHSDEWDSLRSWEDLFKRKYLLVGKLIENTQ
ncbi:cytochrome b5-like heme/steroid binding domain-containing protein [Sporodiniella umbellata]|nr:cytochrome b5-like heme/steroid binding domain-containing protein [Sporodiniella umbellata]